MITRLNQATVLVTLVGLALACGGEDGDENGASQGHGAGGESWSVTYSGYTQGAVDGTYILLVALGPSSRIEMQGSAVDGNPFGSQSDGPRLTLARTSATGEIFQDLVTFDFERESISDCSTQFTSTPGEPASGLFEFTQNDANGVAGTLNVAMDCADGMLDLSGSFQTPDAF